MGTEIIDDTDHQTQGTVVDILMDPDRGVLLALLLLIPGTSELFALQTQDITNWGNRIHVQGTDVIGPASDFIRLQPFLQDPRTLIRQRIRTEDGTSLGRCIDLQFEATTFVLEWIFPRKFFRKGLAIPANEILEVTEEAIIVKNQGPRAEKEPSSVEEVSPQAETVMKPAVGRSRR